MIYFLVKLYLTSGKDQFKKYGAIYLIERVYLSNSKNNNYLLKVINKIMHCELIKEKYKKEIKFKFWKLLVNKND